MFRLIAVIATLVFAAACSFVIQKYDGAGELWADLSKIFSGFFGKKNEQIRMMDLGNDFAPRKTERSFNHEKGYWEGEKDK